MANTIDSLTPENATLAWDILAECVEAFVAGWAAQPLGPRLADYLPAAGAALRRLALVELIKIDLEQRWRDRQEGPKIEDYVREFGELAEGDGVPGDLVYEEYHVRKQAGEDVDVQEYYQRFPQQAGELARWFGCEAPHLSTTMVGGGATAELDAGDQVDDFDLLSRLGKGAF